MPPYSAMTGVVKRTESFAISRASGGHINFFGPVRKNANCCADHCLLPPPFCCGRRSQRLERKGSDHICIITRMRLGILPPDSRTRYPSIHPADVTQLAYNGSLRTKYNVPKIRADALWRTRLDSRHIDMLKIDVDAPWQHTGIEGLIEQRAFSVMTIEVDSGWGGAASPPMDPWNVTSVDQLVWFARSNGYTAFLKVPCRSRNSTTGPGNTMEPRWSAKYVPLADVNSDFLPAAYYAVGYVGIHDLLLVDGNSQIQTEASTQRQAASRATGAGGGHSATSLASHLERRGREDCRP